MVFPINLHAKTLENDNLKITFNDRGIVSVYDKMVQKNLELKTDHWSFSIDNNLIESNNLVPVQRDDNSNSTRFHYTTNDYDITVEYELKPGWRFVSKQLFISHTNSDVYRVNSVSVLHGHFTNSILDIYVAGLDERARKNRRLGDYGAFVRIDEKWGAMFLVQNPFFNWKYDKGDFSMAYFPDMEWKNSYGRFVSDRAFIGTYDRTGFYHQGDIEHHGKWLLKPTWGLQQKEVDMGEVDAFVECVRAFLLFKPDKSFRIHVPWCENDYQIDVATEYGEAQYKRIVNTTSALGIDHMFYTVRNTDVALLEDASDNWQWEHLLWLNMGIKIRKNQWDPQRDILPQKTLDLMDYARKKGVNLMAYVYPTLEFQQDKSWIVERSKNNPQPVATFASRAFQDWFIDNLVAFMKNTGISGYAFDYWSMKVGDHSRYAQWYGGRRVLEELRKQIPDIVIDGRQQYHGYGPWTWLAGNYPHPTGGDEQPESFESFPDLHFDRSSANQQRITSYWYRNVQFCPTELMPGFITHQTARKDSNGFNPRESDLNLRDWDYLGWKYSLISSVATAPFSHCVDMIPARDQAEYDLFIKDTVSHNFIKGWFDWTDRNAEILKNMRSIIGPPQIGHVDGTAAIDEDHGFIFVFNPNHRKIKAEFVLDKRIGLTKGDNFLLKQIYPLKNVYTGTESKAVLKYGDTFSRMMDGTTAWVFQVEPLGTFDSPVLFNTAGQADYNDNTLILKGISGEYGKKQNIHVLLPEEKSVKKVTVNGINMPFKQQGALITITCQFAGKYFSHNQALTNYDPSFTNDIVNTKFVVPERIFTQLNERKQKWNIDWTEEDLKCSWLAPERLLLYIQIAEPDWRMNVDVKINSKPVKVNKAYSSRTPGRLKMGKGHNTFTGFFVDVSDLQANTEYEVQVKLPSDLKPGQFQGIFFENIVTEYTDEIKVME